jgi:hypothetical protein
MAARLSSASKKRSGLSFGVLQDRRWCYGTWLQDFQNKKQMKGQHNAGQRCAANYMDGNILDRLCLVCLADPQVILQLVVGTTASTQCSANCRLECAFLF